MGRRRAVPCGALLTAAAFAAVTAMRATPARGAQAHFRVDPGATQITAAVAEPLSSIRGDATASFRAVSGEVDDPDGNPSHARVTIVIDASSYNSGSAMRDRAVTGSVLAAGQYPTITFKSTGLIHVKINSQRSGSATMMGKLTLHGETRPIEFPVSASLGDDGRLTAEGVATFDYTQFGIRSPSILGLSAGSVVMVSFHAVAVGTASRLTALRLQRARISSTSSSAGSRSAVVARPDAPLAGCCIREATESNPWSASTSIDCSSSVPAPSPTCAHVADPLFNNRPLGNRAL